MQARLLLEDGTVFTGVSFGADTEKVGELVFNTGMTGYQELISDPSYYGQVVTMTYPLIGNYGITRDDFESLDPKIFGLIVRRYEPIPSNWRAEVSLGKLLEEHNIPAIAEVDTRMLTRKIREHGSMKCLITTSNDSVEELTKRLNAAPTIHDQVAKTSTTFVYPNPGNKERIVLIDCGSKNGIIKELLKRNCDIVVVPHTTTADEIRKLAPDGIQVSNGPGDPKDNPQIIETIKQLLGEYPIFGICLGHQLLSLACGADTEKLKFGHRGGNHPVYEFETKRCYITSQNHSYAVKKDSIAHTDLEITHINNNDKTVEGVKHKKYPAFSVQYHPEAAPGPNDSSYLFDRFIAMIREHKINNPQKPRQAVLQASLRGEL